MSQPAARLDPAYATQAALSAAVLVLAGLLGGGRGGPGDTLVQLSAIVLLAYLLWMASRRRLHWHGPRWARWLPCLAIALPVFQLLPVPEFVWMASPARVELARQLSIAGASHVGVLTLNPAATERALWSLLPASAVFLSALTLRQSTLRWLLAVVLVLAVLNLFLGMAQLHGGRESELRFYTPTNTSEAVGLFANRNHFAGLLVMALPLALIASAWSISESLANRRISLMWPLTGVSIVILLILGIVLARSRAGLLLGMVAALGCVPIVMSLRKQRGTRRLLLAAIAAGFILSFQFAMLGMMQRLASDPLDDGRWEYARITLQAAKAHAPVGSGLGTFRQAYQPFEARGTPDDNIVNHAHDDYLELWLEGSWLAMGLLAIGAVAWSWLTLLLWRGRAGEDPAEAAIRLLGRTAWLAASMALLHSALDYPLRTTADMTVFALMAAVAFASLARRRGISEAEIS